MKVFSKEKFIEAKKNEGQSDEYIQYLLDTWVRRIDGQKVINGRIGSFPVNDAWCIEVKEKDECER